MGPTERLASYTSFGRVNESVNDVEMTEENERVAVGAGESMEPMPAKQDATDAAPTVKHPHLLMGAED